MKCRGSLVALVTPFKNGNPEKLDEPTLRALIEFQIAGGTHGIVPCGTSGESATLTHDEHKRVVEITVETVNGRVPVIAGTGSNSTAEAIAFTRHAKRVGADAALLITPYYNKPTQAGLYQHYRAVAQAVDLPLVLYNIPGRTAVNMTPATVARLAKIDTIVGIKEGSGSISQVMEVIRLCGEQFSVLSGDDAMTLPILACGGHGVISVTANIVPREMAELVQAFETGDLKRARALHYWLMPLCDAMFLETNPIPVKTVLGWMKRCAPDLRLPLTPMAAETAAQLRRIVEPFGLLRRAEAGPPKKGRRP